VRWLRKLPGKDKVSGSTAYSYQVRPATIVTPCSPFRGPFRQCLSGCSPGPSTNDVRLVVPVCCCVTERGWSAAAQDGLGPAVLPDRGADTPPSALLSPTRPSLVERLILIVVLVRTCVLYDVLQEELKSYILLNRAAIESHIPEMRQPYPKERAAWK
jgi:hypothetical protein